MIAQDHPLTAHSPWIQTPRSATLMLCAIRCQCDEINLSTQIRQENLIRYLFDQILKHKHLHRSR